VAKAPFPWIFEARMVNASERDPAK
jgi:hypothetical protein